MKFETLLITLSFFVVASATMLASSFSRPVYSHSSSNNLNISQKNKYLTDKYNDVVLESENIKVNEIN